jgi:hypothetical protein
MIKVEGFIDEEEMKEKGVKKCPWCTRMIEKTEGCNFMTCLCGKEFCFKCGAIEIDDHKCINACVLFDNDEPDNKIKRNLRRDIKQHEKDSIAKLRQAFIDKTKKDREFVQRYYRTES